MLLTSCRWRMAMSHCYWHLQVKNGNFSLVLMSSHLEWHFHIAADNVEVKNDNFTFLLTCLLVKNGNFTFQLTSSGLEWQFCTFYYWHLVVKICQFHIATGISSGQYIGNFSLLLTSTLVKKGNFTLQLISSCSRKALEHCYWYPVSQECQCLKLLLTCLVV